MVLVEPLLLINMGLANRGCAALNALFPYNSHILHAKILSIHHCPVTGVLLTLEINNGEYMFFGVFFHWGMHILFQFWLLWLFVQHSKTV